MKKLFVLLVLCVGSLMVGCGVLDDAPARARRHAQITEWNLKQAADDCDYFWLYDRSSQLTQWHPHVGL